MNHEAISSTSVIDWPLNVIAYHGKSSGITAIEQYAPEQRILVIQSNVDIER